jgi:integrase
MHAREAPMKVGMTDPRNNPGAKGGNGMEDSYMKIIERFQIERNPTENTMKAFRRTVSGFIDFAQSKGRTTLDDITREDVIEWLNSLVDVRTSSKKGAERWITLFFSRAFEGGYRREKMPMIGYRGPADVPRAPLKAFTAEEMATMQKNIKRLDLRERIIFNLLSNRPLRIQELANLKVGDIDLKAKTFAIYRSKNTKTRILSLPKETLNDLREYISPDSSTEAPLFSISLRGLSFWVGEIIKKLRVNPNGRGSHGFRHYVIMSMLRDGKIDPAVVATIAGNTPETIYQNYSKQVSIDEQRRAEKAFDRVKGNALKVS